MGTMDLAISVACAESKTRYGVLARCSNTVSMSDRASVTSSVSKSGRLDIHKHRTGPSMELPLLAVIASTIRRLEFSESVLPNFSNSRGCIEVYHAWPVRTFIKLRRSKLKHDVMVKFITEYLRIDFAFQLTFLCPRTAQRLGEGAFAPKPGARCYGLWNRRTLTIPGGNKRSPKEIRSTGTLPKWIKSQQISPISLVDIL